MRLIVCLEDHSEGRVLASVDIEDIVKMTITDDIEKSNFNPQMLKSCTDTSYQSGYQQGKVDGIDECIEILKESYPIIDNEDILAILYGFSCAINKIEQLKEAKSDNKLS